MATRDAKFAVGVAWLAFLGFSVVYVPLFILLGRGSGLVAGFLLWPLAAWGSYSLLMIALYLVGWFNAASQPSGSAIRIGPFEPARWSRRTGLEGFDRVGVLLSGFATLLVWRSAFWLPWLAVLSLLFAVSAVVLGKDPWPVESGRDIPLPEPELPDDEGANTIHREWSWGCLCRPVQSQVRLNLRTATADARAQQNPSHQALSADRWPVAVTELVTTGATDREPREAARQLLAFARNLRFNYFEEAQNTLQFVQTIPYAYDDATKGKEYFRFAIETLYDNAGDCDCKAVLASTLFRLMGLRSVVLLSEQEGHAAVAVEGAPDFPGNRYFPWRGGRYYFCETTDGSFSFTVGEVPPGVNLDRYTVRVEVEPGLHTA